MLDFSQFKQLTNLSDLKSHQSTKFIVLPKDLKSEISLKTLLEESTSIDLGDKSSVLHIFRDLSSFHYQTDIFHLIDLDEIFNIVSIVYDEDDREDYLIVFENEKAFTRFFEKRTDLLSNTVYLELDDQMIDELVVINKEEKLRFYEEKIANLKPHIEELTADLEFFESEKAKLQGELTNG